MKDKEKQNISMKEMQREKSIGTFTTCRQVKEGAFVDLLNQEQAELQKAMIEKIKLIIDERCEAELGQVHASSMGGKVTKTVSTKLIAKDIYEYLTKDSVVLSREEYDEFLRQIFLIDELKDCVKLASKETAEKIYLQAKAIVDSTKWIVQGREYLHLDALKEIIKSCGVEIKEN